MTNAFTDKMKKTKKTVREKFLAALMLSGANRAKYNNLKQDMKENFATGTSTYPRALRLYSKSSTHISHLLGGTNTDRKQEQRAKKEQCLLRPATGEMTRGSQGRTASNAERRGTLHGSAH